MRLFDALGHAFFAGSLSLLLVLSYLSVAGLSRNAEMSGPFRADSEAGSMLVAIDLPDGSWDCCLTTRPDGMASPNRSRLRLWVQDQEVTPAHTLHAAIRAGDRGFSHWGNSVYFSMRPGESNNSNTRARLSYNLYVALPAVLAWAVWTTLLGAGLYGGRAVSFLRTPGAKTKVLLAIGHTTVGLLSLLFFAVVLLQDTLLIQTRVLAGPFANEAGTALHTVSVPVDGPLSCCTTVRSDRSGHEESSSLRLWVNDQEQIPAHAPHATIRSGGPGFNHWVDGVYFSLPDGVENTPDAQVTLVYAAEPKPWVAAILGVLALGLFGMLHKREISAAAHNPAIVKRELARLPYHILIIIGWALLVAAALYTIAIVGGGLAGDPLPISVPFKTDFGASLATRYEVALPLFLLLLSAAAALLAALLGREARRAARKQELAVMRWMSRYGLPVTIAFFIASVGATWAGLFLTGSTSTIAGLVPFFDAGGYYADVHTFLRDGVWSEFSSRRPLAAAARTTVFLLGGMRYESVIFAQAVALATASYFAAMAVIRWRGVWPGVSLLALLYILVRTQITTTMTEPLALIAAIGSLPFLVEALRTRSRLNALVGLALMTAAIWMRPGSMFTVPALALWFALFCGDSLWGKVRHFGIACITVLAVLAIDVVIGSMMSSGSPGNFGYTLCGLSIGGAWDACLHRYADELAIRNFGASDAQAMSNWLYEHAFQNLREDPSPFIQLLLSEPVRFLRELPGVMLRGYSNISIPADFPLMPWYAIVIGMTICGSWRWRSEALWWALVFASIVASSTIFYYSDGVRTFSVVYVLVALFLALAFAAPDAPNLRNPKLQARVARVAAGALAAASVAVLVVPLAARHLYETPRVAMQPGPAIVGPMARATGVLVIADDAPAPSLGPSLPVTRFSDFVRRSGVEASQGLVTPSPPPLPFAFISVPRLDTAGTLTLIAPPEMFFRRDVAGWRVSLAEWHPTGLLYSGNWSLVTSATPLSERELTELSRQTRLGPLDAANYIPVAPSTNATNANEGSSSPISSQP